MTYSTTPSIPSKRQHADLFSPNTAKEAPRRLSVRFQPHPATAAREEIMPPSRVYAALDDGEVPIPLLQLPSPIDPVRKVPKPETIEEDEESDDDDDDDDDDDETVEEIEAMVAKTNQIIELALRESAIMATDMDVDSPSSPCVLSSSAVDGNPRRGGEAIVLADEDDPLSSATYMDTTLTWHEQFFTDDSGHLAIYDVLDREQGGFSLYRPEIGTDWYMMREPQNDHGEYFRNGAPILTLTTPEGEELYLVDLIYHYDEADFEVSSEGEEEGDGEATDDEEMF